MDKFKKLWLDEIIVENIKKKWYLEPTPIQEKVIPEFLKNDSDIIWQADTWTGKTASFWLPIIQLLSQKKKLDWKIKALIFTPTRELAIQITKELNSFNWSIWLKIFSIYWWQSYLVEKKMIDNWIDILVWTPWRVIDHINKWKLDFSAVEFFILDEADEMLKMWFIEDVEFMLTKCPKQKKMLFFSATMPKRILDIAKKFMNDYKIISIKKDENNIPLTKQFYYVVPFVDRINALIRIVEFEEEFYWICFCKTKLDVDHIYKQLNSKWIICEWIHWDITQKQREIVLWKFRRWEIKILLATDVAARWIDIKDLTHVINFSLPQNINDYTHRIWRTGRAWKSWTAINFVSRFEERSIRELEYVSKVKIEKKQLPTIEELVEKKKNNFISIISKSIDDSSSQQYLQMATDLLKISNPEIVLSTILNKFLWNKYLEYWYDQINLNSSINEEKSFENKSNYRRTNNNSWWKFYWLSRTSWTSRSPSKYSSSKQNYSSSNFNKYKKTNKFVSKKRD